MKANFRHLQFYKPKPKGHFPEVENSYVSANAGNVIGSDIDV